MPADDLREIASYLVKCSWTSLGSFYLQRLDRASHLERLLRDGLREWVQAQAAVELADLLRQHGEEIIATNAHVLPAGPRSAPSKPQNPRNYWWHLVEASCISIVELGVCMCIQRWAAKGKSQDGWTDKLGMADITFGKLSPGRTKAVLRGLRDRNFVETQGRPGDPNGQRYRITLESEWNRKDERKRKKGRTGEPRVGMRFSIGPDSFRVWSDGTPEPKVLPGRPTLSVEVDGALLKKWTMGEGSAAIRVPKASAVETGGIINAPGSSTGSVTDPSSQATRSVIDPGSGTTGSVTDPSSQATRSVIDPGSSSVAETEIRITRIPVMEGHVLVKHPRGVNPYTNRERREMARKHGGQPRAERIVEYLIKKTYEAEIKYRPDWKGWPTPVPKVALRPEPKREQIMLARGSSGVWDKAKLRLEEKINAHTFETWFRYTREEGVTADGTIVVRVPSSPFKKRMREVFSAEVRVAIADATGDAKRHVEFVTEDDDIVPAGAITLGQYSKSIAKGGTHK